MNFTTFNRLGYTRNLKMIAEMNQSDPDEESKSDNDEPAARRFIKPEIYSCARYDKTFKELLTQLGIDQLSNQQILRAYLGLYENK